jgi:hypothetical protein
MENTTGVKTASGRSWAIPVPAFPGQVCATMSELVAGSALSAATTWDAVDDSAPDGPVARPTTMSKAAGPVEAVLMLSGEFAAPGSASCTRTVVAL